MAMDAVIDLVDWYRELYREDPNSQVTLEYMKFLYEDGEWEELSNVAENRLKQSPRCIISRAYMGLAALKLGKSGLARQMLLEMHEKLDFLKDAYAALAFLEKNHGNTEIAERFEKVATALGLAQGITGLSDLAPTEQIDFALEEMEEASQPAQAKVSVLRLFCEKAIPRIDKKLSHLETSKGQSKIFDEELKKLIKEYFLGHLSTAEV